MTPRSVLRLVAGVAVLAAIAVTVTHEPAPRSAASPIQRVAPNLKRLHATGVGTTPFALEPLFPQWTFDEVLFATQPERDGPLYALEQKGVLWRIEPDGSAREPALDLGSRVYFEPGNEAGAVGVAVRPERGDAYLFYVTLRDDTMYDRVSRFALSDDGIDPDSEEVLIEQLHEWHRAHPFGEHYGGGLVFGPDGHLYVAFGDEGWVPVRDNAQRLDKDLFSGILRLDVDCTPGSSHPPPRQPESGTTSGYCIPDDNPFVGEPNTLEEFYAIGLRNPYRFSFDRETRAMWIGDAGSDKFEEINLGVAGGNYQWSYREGASRYTGSALRGRRPRPLRGVERPPLFAYPHSSGNGCIIGGHVYRGRAHPDLVGRYVFGDINSGRIWALLTDTDGQVVELEQIAQAPPYTLLSFGELADGELLVIGRPPLGLSRLVPTERGGETPRLLSETGLFSDVATLTPAPGVLPYEINLPAWTDGARSRYWIAIPGDGSNEGGAAKRDRILFRPTGPWGFPGGSVFVQHLDLALDPRRPGEHTPVETRVLVLTREGAAHPLSYVWNDDGTDATLQTDGRPIELDAGRADDSSTARLWKPPSPSECLRCHHLGVGHVLGVNARQLQRRASDSSDGPDQIRAWAASRMFTKTDLQLLSVEGSAIDSVAPLVPPTATDASLERRARSYLDANCGSCHHPTSGLFDLQRRASLAPLHDRPGRHDFGHDGARLLVPGAPERSLLYLRLASDVPREQMPPVGRTIPDPVGARLIRDYIAAMEPAQSESDAAGGPGSSPAR